MKLNKNGFFSIVIIFLVYGILSLSCATDSGVSSASKTPEKKVIFDVSYEYESENPSMTVIVSPFWNKGLPGYGGFSCGFTNNTNKVAKIVWEGSTIYYGGKSYLPFIEGQKYIDAKSNPMPATVLPKGGYLLKEVYSSEQPYYSSGSYGGWNMFPIMAKDIQIIFQIESENGSEYVTVNISYHYEEEQTNIESSELSVSTSA